MEKGIQSLIHYPIPPHKQEAYSTYANLSFPKTELIHEQVLSLPLSGVISISELEKVVTAVNEF
jgi:dTDP-4-amino-4,6-dideoxygalactose transaminase